MRGARKRNSAWAVVEAICDAPFVEAACDAPFVEAVGDDAFIEMVCGDEVVDAGGDDEFVEAGGDDALCDGAFASARWKVPNFPKGAEIFQTPVPQSK